ncbi:rhomboid family intramembrane serine protease [Allosphingosinicella sp.]|jgi:membrane associated rhomboid family serine protease|uniref:rhomboid family intramembrane serine protease n=1 Tax=Allosphingosinicella sp. TaxID=2823234 RepID=UPI002EFCCE98
MRPPQSWRTAQVTVFIAVATAAASLTVELFGLWEWALHAAFFADRPDELGGVPSWLTPLTATLIHIDILHLAFNMLMLVYCGRSVEAVLGPASLAILYLVGAYAAAAGQYLVDPASQLPMVGASGAVSAVIGAYAMLFGRNKVRVADARLAMWLNALWLMAGWVGLQLLIGYASGAYGLGVAIFAHIGGFIAGVLLARPLLIFRYRKA